MEWRLGRGRSFNRDCTGHVSGSCPRVRFLCEFVIRHKTACLSKPTLLKIENDFLSAHIAVIVRVQVKNRMVQSSTKMVMPGKIRKIARVIGNSSRRSIQIKRHTVKLVVTGKTIFLPYDEARPQVNRIPVVVKSSESKDICISFENSGCFFWVRHFKLVIRSIRISAVVEERYM